MDPINGKRVLAGGLVAALVMLAGEMLIEVLTGGPAAWLEALGRPAPGEEVAVFAIAMSVGVGVVAVWLYAAVRSRYGAGPRTALRVALAVWFLGCLVPETGMLAMGIRPANLYWPSIVLSLVSVVLATLAGARLYREARETVGAVAARHSQPVT